ncbi:MAG TPA: nicotinate (nicotinamide) nucleotide adenylyltransferase [Candidatus Krumholzibacteria bacterium]|nr:nicotinate (nicotinamide) nucleotide adenylyltransferase [Candidatus Krumholzibacteria bacterium]
MIRALFGGSFDPVHNGHVAIVAHLLARGLADRVTVVPAALSPHKAGGSAPGDARLAMTRLAFAGRTEVEVDPCELERPAPSYTVDTLEHLSARHPGDRWRLVIGADHAAGFAGWRSAARLWELAELVIMPRGGEAATAPPGVPPERCITVRDFDEPVSSSAIRAMLAAGRLPADALPAAVARHIRAHGLYGVGRDGPAAR